MALPVPPPNTDNRSGWEEEFFKKHGITDDKEKDAIRGRARVLAYDRARSRAEESESTPKTSKWYEE